MTTNTKIAYWLHDRAAEMIDGDDDTFPDALRALVKRLLLEEKAAELAPAERKPVTGWADTNGDARDLSLSAAHAAMRAAVAHPTATLTDAEMAAELRRDGAWRGNSGCWIWPNEEPSGLRTADAHAALVAGRGAK